MIEDFVDDGRPAYGDSILDRINEMENHRRSVIRKLKESGAWSEEEIREIARIIDRKIHAWDQLRGVDLHNFDLGKWLCEGE